MPESLNIAGIFEHIFSGTPLAHYARIWENVFFSLLAGLILTLVAIKAGRKITAIPSRLQNAVELVVGFFDDFVQGILGPQGREFTPFIGTLFIYILFMNVIGIVPLMKSSTSNFSTTAALAVCVFFYVQYTAVKKNGLLGYLDHMMGKPRGFIIFTVFIPILIFSIHVITELVRPLSLALRLRSNIWAEDALLSVAAGFGYAGIPLLVFSMFLAILSSIIQAAVFCLLTTIYFALVLPEQEEHQPINA